MTIEESVEYLKKNQVCLEKQLQVASQRLTETLMKELMAIQPLVEYMKKNRFNFRNSCIPNWQTVHGVILGERRMNGITQLILYDGSDLTKGRWLNCANTTDGKISGEIALDNLVLDHSLSIIKAGIGYVRSFPETYIEEMTKEINEKELFMGELERAYIHPQP